MWERYINWLPLTHPQPGNLAHKPGTCPDWELNRWPVGLKASVQPTEPHQPGHTSDIDLVNVYFFIPITKEDQKQYACGTVTYNIKLQFCLTAILTLLFSTKYNLKTSRPHERLHRWPLADWTEWTREWTKGSWYPKVPRNTFRKWEINSMWTERPATSMFWGWSGRGHFRTTLHSKRQTAGTLSLGQDGIRGTVLTLHLKQLKN